MGPRVKAQTNMGATPEERAAIVMQTRYRGHLTRMTSNKRRGKNNEKLILSNVRAHNLTSGNRALPSPYVTIRLERGFKEFTDKSTTPVRHNDVNPHWPQLELTYEGVPRPAILNIEVFDRDYEGNDDMIALRRVRVPDLRGSMRSLQLWPTADAGVDLNLSAQHSYGAAASSPPESSVVSCWPTAEFTAQEAQETQAGAPASVSRALGALAGNLGGGGGKPGLKRSGSLLKSGRVFTPFSIVSDGAALASSFPSQPLSQRTSVFP